MTISPTESMNLYTSFVYFVFEFAGGLGMIYTAWQHRALFLDLKLYLPGDLLTLTDRISMAHSLEVRVPFLDHHLL